jgi:reactive intermediate/imine deaminase
MINIKIRLFFLCTISIISILTFSKEPNQMTKEIISTENAPQAIGPYSQAVKAGNLIFISGQVPLNPKTGDLVTESIEDQARQVLDNVKSICESAGQSLDDIVKISIFLTDLSNFSVVNDVMMEYFSEPYPARATVEVSGLPLGVNVEIEAIVLING